jgi:hypothetical protein
MKLTKTNIIQKYGISILIISVQILDIIVHFLTNQLEMIRVQSNIVIMMWTIFLFIQTRAFSKSMITTISISIYLILNLLFIFQYGLVNSLSGNLRIALIMFVLLTVSLAFIQTNQLKIKR